MQNNNSNKMHCIFKCAHTCAFAIISHYLSFQVICETECIVDSAPDYACDISALTDIMLKVDNDVDASF